MNTPIYIPMTVSVDAETIPMSVAHDAVVLPMLVDVAINATTSPAYTGAYEYTPTQELQTVYIEDKRATQNIVVNPIPNNYGLITWNGAVLTVS